MFRHLTAAVMAGVAAGVLAAGTASATPPSSGHEPVVDRSAARALAAGTITWIKGNNVWVSRPDGTGARQLTKDGTAAKPWASPTGSDKGEIVAVHGTTIVRMDQWGTVLTVLDPPNLRSGGGKTLGGTPAQAAVSPDGRTIAYSYVRRYCSTNGFCRDWPVTGFTSATSVTNPGRYGTSYGDTPSWVTNARVALNTHGPFDNLYLYDLGVGPAHDYWFDDANIHTDDLDLSDLGVSLASKFGAAVRGRLDAARIAFYDLSTSGNFRTGGPTPAVTQLCETTTVNGIGSPAFSADGLTAAWHEPDGVWTVSMGDQACLVQPQLTVPGARQPSFTRAQLQTTRPTYSFTMSVRPSIKGTPAVGRKLTAKIGSYNPKPATVRLQWLRGTTVIKGATRSTYTVGRADRGRKLVLKVSIARSGYRPAYALSKPVTVKR